ncbi:hypothetical protein [Micromonospora sp. RP3T]|uniref:hypothetical protein n=1 Tax=Micromonospora sp. RP3T TaxID=2135446 RepID=UPI003D72662B
MPASPWWSEPAARIEQDRFGWAFDAYEQFLQDLAPEIRRTTATGAGELDAALYGETQVGKTTLLLTLLGVDPAHHDEIAAVLRAGRQVGESSTPTAFRYAAAAGPDWTWRASAGEPPQTVTAGEIQKRIQGVRAAVIDGRTSAASVIEIGLPAGCFTRPGGEGVRILDLPGVAAADRAEDRHAYRLLDRWINVSDMVILIALISGQGPLQPSVQEVESLRNWPRQLRRFRVVLTHAFSNEQTLDWLDETPPAGRTMAALRISILDDMPNSDGLQIVGAEWNAGAWLYPLEFGRSWNALIRADPQHPAIALRDEFLAALRADLAGARRPENRVRRAFEAHDVACEIQQRRRTELDAAVAACDHAVHGSEATCELREKAIAGFRERLGHLARAREALEALSPPRLGTTTDATNIRIRDLSTIDRELLDAYRAAWATWRQDERRLLRSFPGDMREPRDPAVSDTVVHRCADDIVERRFGRFRDSTGAPGGFLIRALVDLNTLTGREMLAAAVTAATGDLGTSLTDFATRRKRISLDRCDTDTADTERRLARTVTALDAERRALAAHRESAHTIREERDRELAILADHVDIASQFPQRLHREFENRMARLRREAAAARAEGPGPALAAAVALLSCARDYDLIRQNR